MLHAAGRPFPKHNLEGSCTLILFKQNMVMVDLFKLVNVDNHVHTT
jgi:hypothetical protein